MSTPGQATKVSTAYADYDNVFLFYPNLIGYARILLAVLSFALMPCCPWLTAITYSTSALLDAFDGYAARHFGQSSRFGAMLDQLTDRCGTLALLMCLCSFYPGATLVWQLSAVVDIASHWLHLHATDLTGGTSHKNVDENTNWLLAQYYTNRSFLFFMCAGNEAFYGFMYTCHFTLGPFRIFQVLAVLCAPVAVVKAGISLVHLVQASHTVVNHDIALRQQARDKAQH